MRSFQDLKASEKLYLDGETALGTRHLLKRPNDTGLTVQCFEHAGGDALRAYVSLHEAAHLWVHNDYEHDAWYVIDVDEPVEVGTDFVIIQRREGNSIRQFEASDDPAPAPLRLAELREVIPKLQADARSAQDRWIANLVATRVMRPDPNTIYLSRENRFQIQDLAPTMAELREWAQLASATS